MEAEAEDVTLKQIAASSVISYYRLRRKERRKESWTRRESPSRLLHRRIGRPRDPHLRNTWRGTGAAGEVKSSSVGGYGRVYSTGYFKLSEPHRVFGPWFGPNVIPNSLKLTLCLDLIWTLKSQRHLELIETHLVFGP